MKAERITLACNNRLPMHWDHHCAIENSFRITRNKLGRVRRFRAETDQASDALDKRIRFTSKFVASLRFKSFLHADGAYCRRYGCGESDDSIGTKNPAKIQRVLAGRYSDVERSDAGGQT